MKAILKIIPAILLFTACRGKKEENKVYIVQKINLEDRLLNAENTKREGSAYSGKYYSAVDSINKFGIGYAYVIPDSLKNKEIMMYVSARIREKELPMEGGIAMTLSSDDQNRFWKMIKADKQIADQWIEVKDSVLLRPDKLKGNYVEFGVFAYKESGKDFLDADNIEIKYKVIN